MANIKLHKNDTNSTTEISNRFIDEYMTNANGEFVKIYLYLLRCMNSSNCSFSISRTADKFDHTEKDIQRALKYWEKMNLLHIEYDENNSISSIYFLESGTTFPKDDTISLKKADISFPTLNQNAESPTTSISSYPKPADTKPIYTANDIVAFREKEEVQELLFVAESYFGRPLTPTDIQTLFYWYDELEFSSDLIVYLLEYCIVNGHSNLRYMEKIALSWKDAHIETVAQAKHNISTHNQLHYAVMKALGINNRSLIPAEVAYIEKWRKEFGFEQDMITEACSRTILAIHQPNFEYTESILSNWKKQNIQTVADIHKSDKAFQAAKITKSVPIKTAAVNRFNNFPQRTYNIDQLEAELLNSKH